MSPLPGRVRQIGYVVRDFDAALASWVAAGVGPLYVLLSLVIPSVRQGPS
jgi:hypothetical protein